jgi:fluoroacetyl-CoA thioesterase
MELKVGLRAEVVTVVSDDDTAERIGSGDVPVLGTPRLLALAEQATVAAVRENLPPGHTSVGTVIRLEHLAASPVGMPVTVIAELTRVDGRRLVFGVTASDADGTVIGSGTIERAVVGRGKFLSRLPR